MKALVLVIAVALAAAQASAQQAGWKDAAPNDAVVSQLAAADEAEQEACGGRFISQSCGSMQHEPEKLSMTLEGLSQTSLHKGDKLVAAIRIKNNGEKPVALAWSTELPSSVLVSGSSRRSYFSAEITLGILKDPHKDYSITLKGGVNLFSAEEGSSTDLTLRPGEWAILRITAVVDCKFGDKCDVITDNSRSLVIAEWHEYRLSRNREGCEFSSSALARRFLRSEPVAVQLAVARND